MTKVPGTSAGTAYYLTGDPANGDRAKDFGAALDLTVAVLFPKDLPLPPDAAVLIVDLDGMWLDAAGRRRWLADLNCSVSALPTFVHGFDFVDEESPIGGNAVLLRRLDGVLLRRLAAHSATVSSPAA